MISKLKPDIAVSLLSDDLSWMVEVLEQVKSGISIADVTKDDMPLIFVNDSFVKMTGYTKAEVLGQNCRFLQGKDDSQDSRFVIRDAIKNARSCEVVLKNYTKSGVLFFNRLELSPVFNSHGVLTYYIGIQNNITEQLQREGEIENQRRINEKLSKLASLGELSSSIVHEINSPLMILYSQLEILRDKIKNSADGPDLVPHVDKCEASYTRIINIIKSLRDFSHEGGDYIIDVVDIHQQIDQTLELCLPRIKGNAIKLKFDNQEIKLMARIHKVQFSQVLINLINNSVDAISSASSLVDQFIEIKCEEDADYIYVKIYDSGPGVPEDIRNLMFQSFFTTKESGKGTGLGLSLSRKFCEKMMGALTYHVDGKRHYFKITLLKG